MTLEAGTAVDRELSRGQEHLYQLSLANGEYASVVVEQRGIDVVVQARRPDGTVIADFQTEIRRDGQELVDIVAGAAGSYVLAIKPGPGPVSGSYSIRLAGRRPAVSSRTPTQD